MGASGNSGGFLRQAALLTSIVVAVATLMFTLILPLYGDSPVPNRVSDAEGMADETRAALCVVHRALERTAQALDTGMANHNQRLIDVLYDEAYRVGAGLDCAPEYHFHGVR